MTSEAALSAEEALREALAHIDAYEDAMGHSYCDLNVGGGWASDDCTCDFGAKRSRWQVALARSQSATEELREALLDVRSFVAEEPAKPGAGLHFAVSQVRILDYLDRRLAALDAEPAAEGRPA